jgi:rubrerythrin
MYKEFAATAKKEGYPQIANLFTKVGEIEKFHEKRYLDLAKELSEKKTFKDQSEVY